LSLTIKSRVGKKYAIYIPKVIVEALGLKEGESILIGVSGNSLIIEKLQDPIHLALHGKKFASITPEEAEEISLEEQEKRIEDSS